MAEKAAQLAVVVQVVLEAAEVIHNTELNLEDLEHQVKETMAVVQMLLIGMVAAAVALVLLVVTVLFLQQVMAATEQHHQ